MVSGLTSVEGSGVGSGSGSPSDSSPGSAAGSPTVDWFAVPRPCAHCSLKLLSGAAWALDTTVPTTAMVRSWMIQFIAIESIVSAPTWAQYTTGKYLYLVTQLRLGLHLYGRGTQLVRVQDAALGPGRLDRHPHGCRVQRVGESYSSIIFDDLPACGPCFLDCISNAIPRPSVWVSSAFAGALRLGRGIKALVGFSHILF